MFPVPPDPVPDDYEGLYLGWDAYVLGSGKSLDFYNSEFFRGRLTIAVNDGAMLKVPDANFIVTKYHEHAHRCRDQYPDTQVVVTRMQHGHEEHIEDTERLVVIDTNVNTMHRWSPEDFPDEGFVASWSSITTAMHWAAFLGARTIFMVGADCGKIDGMGRCDGYFHPHATGQEHFWPVYERQSQQVATILHERYGCYTYSLLPFVTPNMDGHTWVSHAGRLN